MKNLRSEVIKYAKMLNSRKLSALRSGNVSVRYKDGFLITPSGAKYSLLKKYIALNIRHNMRNQLRRLQIIGKVKLSAKRLSLISMRLNYYRNLPNE